MTGTFRDRKILGLKHSQDKESQNLYVLRQLELSENLTEMKGCNYVANLHIMTIYNTNIVLVNDNVFQKIGLNKSILSQCIKQKMNSDVNQGP